MPSTPRARTDLRRVDAPAGHGLAAALGVTRVARLTDLDRTGIEVAAAVRPSGHVLQVSQGKGINWAHAERSALGEAAELWAAETPELTSLTWGTPLTLPGTVDGGPEHLLGAYVAGRWSDDGRGAWVPADAVYCPPQGCFLGPERARWSSNGLASHPQRARAVEHAWLELVERDAVAQTLPDGFTIGAVRRRRLEPTGALTHALSARGFEVLAFNLTPARAQVPTVGALLFDVEGGPVPLTAGYAARRSGQAALDAAVLEAAQSRLTEIHGAREDVTLGDREAGGAFREAASRLPCGAQASALRGVRSGPVDVRPVVVVVLRRSPLHVVKAWSPAYRTTEML